MKECELCGRESELMKARIEDTVLSVCKKCCYLGIKIEEAEKAVTQKISDKIQLTEIIPDFAQKIKNAREEAGISKTDLANKLGISPSLLTRIEKGMRPTDKIVKKLEKALNISLFYKETVIATKTEKLPEVTLGDVVQLRLRKK